MSAPADPAYAERARSRRVWFPVVAVMLALAASLLLPAALDLRENTLRLKNDEIIRPARRLIAAKKAAVLGGAAARAGYMASGNAEMLRRADRYAVEVDSLDRELRALVPGTSPRTVAAFARVAALEAAVAADFPNTGPSRDELYQFLPALDASLTHIVAAMDTVDLALQQVMGDQMAGMDRLERLSHAVTGGLGLLGVVAIVSVARLTRREQRARAEAEAAVRLRDDVVSVVSHDLRNPLNTITMAASFLLDTLPPGDERKTERGQLAIIGRAGASMNHMIQDLLDIARIEGGRLAVECRTIPARSLAQEASTMLAPIVEKAGQRFACSLPEHLPAVSADRERTLQIFSNLVGNAAKFTPPGGTIALGADVEGSSVWFRVSDTGTGIPSENIPRLFDRFWQAGTSDRRGIGLGLPIVKGLVEAQGGTIRVESRVGEGSTFSFSVPQAG